MPTYDLFEIDLNPHSKTLAKALDDLADSNAALHAQTLRLAKRNRDFEAYLQGKPAPSSPPPPPAKR